MRGSVRLVETIDVGDQLGECVLWRALDQTLWWTDIHGCRLHCLDWPSLRLSTFPVPQRLCSFGFVAQSRTHIVAAFESGFALFEPQSGQIQWLSRPEELVRGRRLNDGRVGPDGSFWSGSMIEAESLRQGGEERTGLYRLDGSGVAEFVRGGFSISNGICWSVGGDTMYVTDTPSGRICRCSYDSSSGRLGQFDCFVDIDHGSPDGAVTDREDRLWSALWGAGKVVCFSSDGSLEEEVAVPALQPTCPAFMGSDFEYLAVTSALSGLSDSELASFPDSGSLFIFQGSFSGLSGNLYSVGSFRL